MKKQRSFKTTSSYQSKGKGKGKAVPLQAWSGPEGSRKLRWSDFMTTALDGGKVVCPTHRPPLPPGNAPGTHFCWTLSRPQSHSAIGRILCQWRIPMTLAGIEPASYQSTWCKTREDFNLQFQAFGKKYKEHCHHQTLRLFFKISYLSHANSVHWLKHIWHIRRIRRLIFTSMYRKIGRKM